jgi:hypothetical protein
VIAEPIRTYGALNHCRLRGCKRASEGVLLTVASAVILGLRSFRRMEPSCYNISFSKASSRVTLHERVQKQRSDNVDGLLERRTWRQVNA